jgi:hypothetical protein
VDQIDLFPSPPPRRRKAQPQEWKVVSLRECPTPDALQMCDTPEKAVQYWNTHVRNHPYISEEGADYIAPCASKTTVPRHPSFSSMVWPRDRVRG